MARHSFALVQFLDHVGGSGSIPSILKPETIRAMTTPSPVFPNTAAAKYARGWMVGGGNMWHNGSLPGSTTIMVRTAAGLCWAALANTRTEPHDEIDNGDLIPCGGARRGFELSSSPCASPS
jgi:hypothetical protein